MPGSLLTALDAANLTTTLRDGGPFTVFAPSDDAFARIPEDALAELLADPDLLASVLTYHVVPGRVSAEDVVGLSSAATVNGKSVAISVTGNTVKVDNATVVATDIEARNGVIHVIDDVLFPEPILDLVQTARKAGSFNTLLAALDAADLTAVLKGEGPFTVFAPTDDAFAALPAGTLEALLADPATLASILTYHVVPGRVTAAQVVGLTSATTVNGASITISVDGSAVQIDDANVLATDVEASNGVIHVIDAVILPPM
ncbi:MAG TPA: fasciclin domain-containing protein [Longimicrobiales bacterium]|nr:fasciclin domain-containing protein [Longimicrobiales bacterium]